MTQEPKKQKIDNNVNNKKKENVVAIEVKVRKLIIQENVSVLWMKRVAVRNASIVINVGIHIRELK